MRRPLPTISVAYTQVLWLDSRDAPQYSKSSDSRDSSRDTANGDDWLDDLTEHLAERAAILEHDGGLERVA